MPYSRTFYAYKQSRYHGSDSRVFNNKAERVVGEFWVNLLHTTMLFTSLSKGIRALIIGYAVSYMQDFYRCDPGYENKVATLAHTVYAKLVKDMHYEACVQAVILYNADVLKVSKKKLEARNILLSREEYMQVNIEYWC